MKLPYLDCVNVDSVYLRQKRGGLRLPSFDSELEQAFAQHHTRAFLRRMRWALLVATVLVLGFAALDALSLPQEVRGGTLALRFGVMLPLLLGAWWATYAARLHRYLQLIVGLCALGCGLAVVGIIWVARLHGFPLPYEGIILVTVFFYFLVGLRFVTALVCGWLVLVAYLLMEMAAGLPTETLLYNAVFLVSANLIGSVGCYFLEYGARESFLAQGLLRELVEKDYLTGLLNRRAFGERAERHWRQAVRECRPLAVVMMDVDYFKRYNDQYGHIAGDAALRAVAQVVSRHARRALDCVARYGGEEFVGLWYGLDEQQARAVLEQIRQEVQALGLPHVNSAVASVVTLSIGFVHLLPSAAQSLEGALQLADSALYLAKEQGRNRVIAAG